MGIFMEKITLENITDRKDANRGYIGAEKVRPIPRWRRCRANSTGLTHSGNFVDNSLFDKAVYRHF
jgi:hypothetical protein